MPVRCLVRPGAYFDSVVLMRIAAELGAAARCARREPRHGDRVEQGRARGRRPARGRGRGRRRRTTSSSPSTRAEDAADDALAAAEEALSATRRARRGRRRRRAPAPAHAGRALGPEDEAPRPRRSISTPGRYAAAEALKALRLGLNVFLFSDNVPLEEEIALKREAHERGLIVMGPDCGTAIVDGVPLGFANAVRAGDIGLVAASGTGLQQVTCLIDGWGAGVSQVIGVGGHDLGAAVGGDLDARRARRARRRPRDARSSCWSRSRRTPRSPSACSAAAAASGKPVVAASSGADPDGAPDGVTMAATLEEAARLLVARVAGDEAPAAGRRARPTPPRRAAARRLLRGLYAGGTFAYEASCCSRRAWADDRRRRRRRRADRAAALPDAHLDPRPRRRPLHRRAARTR